MLDNMTTDQWELVFTGAAVVVLLVIAALLTYAISAYAPASSGGGSSGDVSGWLRTLQREPVRVRTAVIALFAVAGSFGLPVSDERQALIVGAILAGLALFAESTRSAVTPVAHPVVPKGTTVKRV